MSEEVKVTIELECESCGSSLDCKNRDITSTVMVVRECSCVGELLKQNEKQISDLEERIRELEESDD